MSNNVLALIGVGMGAAGVFLLARGAKAAEFPGIGFFKHDDILVTPRDSAVYSVKDFLRPEDVKYVYLQYAKGGDINIIENLFRQVLIQIDYQLDDGEYFRFPLETWNEKVGDCEDTTFLFSSLLLNRFSDIYATIGYFHYGGYMWGHAWVTVKYKDSYFTFETTLDSMPGNPWVTVEELANYYSPIVYYNRGIIWAKPGYELILHFSQLGGKKEALEELWQKLGQGGRIMAREHGPHECYCTQCGYTEIVPANVPCRELKCSACGSQMRARETGEYRGTEYGQSRGISRRVE